MSCFLNLQEDWLSITNVLWVAVDFDISLSWCLKFLKYPESTRKHIYTTNPVESVHSSFEKMRIKKGGFFQSMDTLNVAIFIVCDKLNLTWKKPIPMTNQSN